MLNLFFHGNTSKLYLVVSQPRSVNIGIIVTGVSKFHLRHRNFFFNLLFFFYFFYFFFFFGFYASCHIYDVSHGIVPSKLYIIYIYQQNLVPRL